jgi:hypothetical protein
MRPWSTARRRVSGSAHAFVEVTSRRLEVESGPSQRAYQITRLHSKCWTQHTQMAAHSQFVMVSLCDLGHMCKRIA